MKLSIIIPAYNAEPYLSKLLDCLDPQMTKSVECLIIDDGSKAAVDTEYKWAKIYRQENQGVSVARNVGIDKAKGDYISFIDADDLVSDQFIKKILEKTKDEPDVIELSWRSLTDKGWNCDQHLKTEADRLSNPSVCTRVFKRSFIGDTRFNTKKDSTEDEDFSRKVGYLDPEVEYKRAVITDYMYFYRDDVPLSKTKRYAKGLMNTKRVIYYYNHVTAEMTWLLDEIKKEDETNEVFLMTPQCDLKGLTRYCQIIPPRDEWAHIIKGEKCSRLTLRKPPLKTQVILYRKNIYNIGGLATFMCQFVERMSDRYDIALMAETVAEERYRQLIGKVRIITQNVMAVDHNGTLVKRGIQAADGPKDIYCDTLIVLSFLDPLPTNVHANKIVRMCHACKTDPSWKIPQDYDDLVYVSGTAMNSFGVHDGTVIHNFNTPAADKALILVSATRLPAPDKGDIERRMRKLANMLNDKGVSFIWFNFADGKLSDPPKHFYNMGVSDNMQAIIKAADYVVQLSDSECWSYTCLEALTNGTALICTPFPSAFEMGVKDGVNAHVIPFNMDFDVTKLRKVPRFKFEYDNDEIVEQWVKILGNTTPRHDYDPQELVQIKVVRTYWSKSLGRDMAFGEMHYTTKERAEELRAGGYIAIV